MNGKSIKIIIFFKVKLTGRRGSSFESDIALDDFKIFHCRKYHCYHNFILYLNKIKYAIKYNLLKWKYDDKKILSIYQILENI